MVDDGTNYTTGDAGTMRTPRSIRLRSRIIDTGDREDRLNFSDTNTTRDYD
jgi:hypothetical protein